MPAHDDRDMNFVVHHHLAAIGTKSLTAIKFSYQALENWLLLHKEEDTQATRHAKACLHDIRSHEKRVTKLIEKPKLSPLPPPILVPEIDQTREEETVPRINQIGIRLIDWTGNATSEKLLTPRFRTEKEAVNFLRRFMQVLLDEALTQRKFQHAELVDRSHHGSTGDDYIDIRCEDYTGINNHWMYHAATTDAIAYEHAHPQHVMTETT
jgi:hypothetical protein